MCNDWLPVLNIHRNASSDMIVKSDMPEASHRESTIRQGYEDPFTLELKEVFALVVDGKTPKIRQVDTRKDLEALGMFMKAIAK